MAVGGPSRVEAAQAGAVHYEQTVSIDVEAAAGISCDYEQAVVPPPPPPPPPPPSIPPPPPRLHLSTDDAAGGVLRTRTPPTLNLLLLRASV